MRPFCLLLAFVGAQAAPPSAPAPEQFQARRARLQKSLQDGVLVLFGSNESDDLRSGFFQEPNFYYLTGWMEPGAMLLLSPDSEALLLPHRDLRHEIYTGKKLDAADPEARARAGFAAVLSTTVFETELHKLLERYDRIYALKDQPTAARLTALEPLRRMADAAMPVAKLRMEKSPEEVALIQHAVDATLHAHRAAWKRAAAGLYEYQVAATMVGVYLEEGCERSSYSPIVGSGPNSTILHYSRNGRRMDRGDMLLMDVGAECAGYAADVTRTIPVGGQFSKRQREVYEAVLGAQQAALAAVKPGAVIGKEQPGSIYQVAYDYLEAHGQLGKYLTHGISHHVGLEVHDAADNLAPLKEGMVITVEPGVYIPEENIGIRIEDTVLVTKDGVRNLSAALPRDPAEIEKALQ